MKAMKNQFDRTTLNQLLIKDTPLGNILCSASPYGLVSLSFYAQAEQVFEDTGPTEALRELKEEIIAYFKGSKAGFSTAVDLSSCSAFQQEVLTACREIPYGVTYTYGQLAKTLGKPKAARAVGGVLARNPILLVIPCHRVVAAGGGLRGYSAVGGLNTKQTLLAHEGAYPYDHPVNEGKTNDRQ